MRKYKDSNDAHSNLCGLGNVATVPFTKQVDRMRPLAMVVIKGAFVDR